MSVDLVFFPIQKYPSSTGFYHFHRLQRLEKEKDQETSVVK